MTDNWRKKNTWVKRHNNFTVEVSRHSDPDIFGEEHHIWCVYAYIHKSHPHFKKFVGEDTCQDATDFMPLHGGCSYLKYLNNGNCVQVGCDYNHYRDDYYTKLETKEDAFAVFADAQKLFDWLINYGSVSDD